MPCAVSAVRWASQALPSARRAQRLFDGDAVLGEDAGGDGGGGLLVVLAGGASGEPVDLDALAVGGLGGQLQRGEGVQGLIEAVDVIR